MMGYGGGFGLLGGLGMGVWLIVSIALVALIVWALVSFFSARGAQVESSPLEILKRRYAKGEISEAEFEQARNRLA
jgi:putative membrane protein